MQYRTIVLELIEQQPELLNRLLTEQTLLEAVNTYATCLKTTHECWIERLSETRPTLDQQQLSSEALELAVYEFQTNLPKPSAANESEAEQSLDVAMAYLRRRTPPA